MRLIQLTGFLEHQGAFWEERLVRPLDVYPEHAAAPGNWHLQGPDGRVTVESCFVQVETDEGVTGLGGPFPPDQAMGRRAGRQGRREFDSFSAIAIPEFALDDLLAPADEEIIQAGPEG